ncbi:unnamed protein product [Camellia sinensis]
MAETSRSRVTITLGRSGQVVKRAGPVVDSGFSEYHPGPGSKRSVRDRLGSDGDGIQLGNKRQRGDSNKLSMNGARGVDDARLGKDDLRFKLMRKNVLRQGKSDVHRNGVDLRDTLSRAVRPSTAGLSTRQRMPEPTDSRHLVTERKDASILGRIPSTRSADALPQMVSLRNSYSPWNLDQLRQRSPDRVLRTSRNLLPQRNEEEITKRPLIRAYDDTRTVSYMSREILEAGRPLGTSPYMTRPAVAAASAKSLVPPPAPPPPPGGIVHKSSYMYLQWKICKKPVPAGWNQVWIIRGQKYLVIAQQIIGNEHLTVDGLLHSLGLEKYAISFKAEEVDMTALRQMGDNDLKDLGIPMGPRKKILLSLLSRTKRQLG